MVMQASCHVHYVGTFYCVLEFTSYGDVSTLWRIKVSHEMTRLPYKCRNRKERFNLQRQGFLCKIALNWRTLAGCEQSDYLSHFNQRPDLRLSVVVVMVSSERMKNGEGEGTQGRKRRRKKWGNFWNGRLGKKRSIFLVQ